MHSCRYWYGSAASDGAAAEVAGPGPSDELAAGADDCAEASAVPGAISSVADSEGGVVDAAGLRTPWQR